MIASIQARLASRAISAAEIGPLLFTRISRFADFG